MRELKKYKPVISISRKGKYMIAVIRFYYRARKWTGFKQWNDIVPDHHEDPLKMRLAESIYMGQKYYYKAMVNPQKNSGLKEYFKQQTLQFHIPGDFIPQQSITISAGGDLIPYKCVTTKTCAHLWQYTGDFFFDADIVFANLETPVDLNKAYSAAPEVMVRNMYFNGNEDSFKVFSGMGKYKGYDVLSIANNHSLDMGEAGLKNTIGFLQSKQIAYTGAALQEEERDNFPIVERDGIKIAFLAYTFSLNTQQLPEGKEWLCNHIALNEAAPDLSLIIHQAQAARQRGADIIVASLHMGCAYQAYPSLHTVKNIHNICTFSGIDIILGGHPHNPQQMEIFESTVPGSLFKKQHFIAYSLADFIAYDIFKWCHLTLLLKLTVTKGILHSRPHCVISKIEVKPAYMHARVKRGKVTSMQLLPMEEVAAQPGRFFSNKKELRKFNEIQLFMNEFINTTPAMHVVKEPVLQ